MNNQHTYRATVLPVSEGTTRPLWSVMIPTYNCAHYLRETLSSVLAQDPGADVMQIEVVDDHSTKDDPKAVVEELGNGRVSFYQQPRNVGHVKNFQTCLERSHGQLIHLLHGDDCVRNGFYKKMQHGFEKYPEIGAAFCRHLFMDEYGHWTWISKLEQRESGILTNWLEQILTYQRIQTPSIVVRRKIYEELGGFDHRMKCWGEDWEMWVRIATRYSVYYEVEPLAMYRKSSSSLTGNAVQTGQNIQDFRQAISIVRDYLPDEYKVITKVTSKNYAFCALDDARKFAVAGNITAAQNQLKEALLCSLSLDVIRSALKISLKVLPQIMSSTLKSGRV